MNKNNFWGAVRNWFKIKSHVALVVAIALILIGSFVASMIQTNFFTVKVWSETIQTEPETSKADQLYQETGVKSWCAADIYMPVEASAENQVPLVFVVPGIQRTKETQSSFCIELVRRGYGVICIDPFGQGESSSSYESQSATQEGYGLFAWMDYVFDNLDGKFDWVDQTKVAACGHSAGGNACQKLAEREGRLAKENKTASRLNSVYITGYIRDFTWSNTMCNVGISYSLNDEGAFQNATAAKKNTILEKSEEDRTAEENWWLTVGNADLRYADESVSLVNYQLGRYDGSSVEKTQIIYEGSTFSVDTVEIGQMYGNPYNGTAVIINNETVSHAFQPYDTLTIEHMLDFFEISFDGENAISSSNQIWWIKELGGLIALCGGFTFICALLCMLLRTKAFASLKKPLPARTANQKVKGRIIFWISFAVSAVIACVLYMVCVQWSVDWFPLASSGSQTWVFPQRFTNAVMLWAIMNGVIGIAIFFITWGIEYLIDYCRARGVTLRSSFRSAKNFFASIFAKISGRQRITTEEYDGFEDIYQEPSALSASAKTAVEDLKDQSYSTLKSNASKEMNVVAVRSSYMQKLEPLKIGGKDFAKTLGLAAILIASFFALDYLIYFIFHVDMRFMFISARVSFNWRAILAMVMYVPFFFVFYFSNSLRVNCSMRPSNWKEWLSNVIAVLANTLGLIAVLFIQYIPMFTDGQIGYTGTEGPQWLFVNLLFSIIPMMIALPLFNRFFFNKTGRAWLGPIVICFIFVIMTGGATTMYYAL